MSEIVIYEDGDVELKTVVENETLWLSQKQLCELFGRDKSVVSRHISNIFKSEELDKHSVVAKNATTAKDGKTYQVDYYNLDMIISLGYRINSKQATNLLYYVIKGHPFNDGNKRIGVYLFVLFLHKNGILYKANGEAKINDNALASLALMVATSADEQKDIIRLVMNMLVEGIYE